MHRCSAGRADIQAQRSSMIRALTSLPLVNTSPVDGGPPGPSIVTAGRWKGCARRPSRCWAQRVRLCSRESSAAARTGAGSGGHLDVCRGNSACYPYGLLGSYAKADVGQASAAPCPAVHCADLEGLPEQLRKQSPTAHLPKASWATADSSTEKRSAMTCPCSGINITRFTGK